MDNENLKKLARAI